MSPRDSKDYPTKTTRSIASLLPYKTQFPIAPQLFLIAFGSGLLMGLTPAPTHAWFLAWIALVPLWVLVTPRSTIRPRLLSNASGYALIWGIGYHGLALSWIRDLHPLTWMGVPWLASIGISLFCWLFITLWGAMIVVLWSWLLRNLDWAIEQRLLKRFTKLGQSPDQQRRSVPIWLRIWIGTALWCGIEWLWSQGSLYWTSLSYTQSPHNLLILHLGQLSGPLTVTAAIVAFNGLVAEAWLQLNLNRNSLKARQLLLAGLIGLLGLHLIGWALYSQPLKDDSSAALKVGIVQGNIPTRIKLFDEGLRLSLERYLEGYNKLVAEKVDAVLTPEGALPWLWILNPGENPLYRSIVQNQVPAWVGTVGVSQGKITQTLFSISGTGEIVGRYNKVKLVPLGEYIPFESVLGKVIDRLSPLGDSMLPGRFDQQFQTPFGLVTAGICYESAFPELFRRQTAAGGQLILTASNNDPYGAAMMAQHHAQDLMRSIETDRWAVRATNTGLSGIVDPHGRTQWISGFRTFETHAHTVYRRQTRTLYVRWGDWFTPLLLISAGLGIWRVVYFE